MSYRWLLTYLFGASPIAEENYFKKGDKLIHPVRSLRQSKKYGFGSNFTPDYTDVESYFARIKRAVVKKRFTQQRNSMDLSVLRVIMWKT